MELYNFKERNRSRTWPTPPTDFINSSLTCKHLLESNGMEFKENSIVGQTPRNARDLYNKTAAQILSDSLLKDQIKNDNFDYYMNIPINDEPSLKFKNSSSYPSVKKEFMSTFITLPLDNNKSSSFGETNDSFISTKKSTPNNHRSTKTSRFNLRKQHRRNAWGTSSYADLITQAISSSPEMKMTLMQIYDWIIQNIPFFKDKTDPVSSSGWKNSIRHNLSLHSRFVRIQTDVNGKSGYWTLIEKVGIGKLKSAGIKLSNEQLNDIDYLFLPKNEQDHSVSLLNPLNKKFTTSLNREQNVTSTSSTQPVRFAQINNKNCNFIPNDSQSSNLSLQQSYTNPYHQSSLNSIMFDDGSNISFNQSINNSHILSVSNNTNDFLATPSSSNLCLSTSNNSTPASSNFLSPFRINTGTNNRHRSLSNDNCPLEDVLSSDSDGLINSNLRYHYSSIVHNEKNSNMNQSLKHLHNFHSVNDIDFMLLDKSVNVNALGNNNLSQSSCNSSVSSFYHSANNSTFANNENNNNVDSKISRNNKFPCHSLNNLSSNSLLLDNFSSNYYDAISDGQPFINAPTNRLLGQNNGETGLIDNLTRSVIDVMNIVSPQVKKRSSSFLESNMKVENDTTLYDLNNNYNKINQMRIFNENLLNHSSPDMINNNSSNVKRQLFPSKDIKLIVTDPSNKIKSTEHLLSNQQSSHLKYNCVHSLQQPTINSESVNKPSSLLTNETVKVTFFNGESRDIPSDLSDLIVDKIFDDYDENLLNNIIHQDILSQTEDVVWKNTTVVVNNNCPNIPILVTSDINNNNSNDKNQ